MFHVLCLLIRHRPQSIVLPLAAATNASEIAELFDAIADLPSFDGASGNIDLIHADAPTLRYLLLLPAMCVGGSIECWPIGDRPKQDKTVCCL